MSVRYKITGKAIGLFIGSDPTTFVTIPQPEVSVLFTGFEGDQHAGITRKSDSRTPHYPRGTEIRNDRQVSIVSVEDLRRIAQKMDLPEVRAEWLGANVLTEDIPNLSLLPPGTHFFFDGGVVLVITAENMPCKNPGGVIQTAYGRERLQELFPNQAKHLRGLVANVEKPGMIRQGETIRIEVPVQVEYRPEPLELP
jgi:hypothetical protein